MNELILDLLQNCVYIPFFGVVISVVSYKAALIIHDRLQNSFINPLLVSSVFIILFLQICHIPYQAFKTGGDILNLFLGPATAVLALSIYSQRKTMLANILPIIAGTFAGAAACILTIFIMSKLFNIDEMILHSMLPKSVTTPIALSLSTSMGGLGGITMACVVATGVFGSVLSPLMIKIFRIKNPVAAGIGIGTCSHAVGTSTALKMGEVYGAMSSISIGAAGIATTIILIFLH